MPHHVGASHWNNRSLAERTRKARKNRGRKRQSLIDKALYRAKESAKQ